MRLMRAMPHTLQAACRCQSVLQRNTPFTGERQPNPLAGAPVPLPIEYILASILVMRSENLTCSVNRSRGGVLFCEGGEVGLGRLMSTHNLQRRHTGNALRLVSQLQATPCRRPPLTFFS